MVPTAVKAAREKTPTWATGTDGGGIRATAMSPKGLAESGTRGRAAGFTLVELMVAIAIAGLLLAVAVPSSMKFYESMQYRSAVRDVVGMLSHARHAAIDGGQARDVSINPKRGELRTGQRRVRVPASVALVVHSARELNRDDSGVIRFYAGGGSSGGGVDVQNAAGSGVRIRVDWLTGSISQDSYAVE
jgi:general secretion pathway protein H